MDYGLALTGINKYGLFGMCSEMPGLCLSEQRLKFVGARAEFRVVRNFLQLSSLLFRVQTRLPVHSTDLRFSAQKGESVVVVHGSALLQLVVFGEADSSAAAPALEAVAVMCDQANESGMVTSHASGLLCNQRINVASSGRLSLALEQIILATCMPRSGPSCFSQDVTGQKMSDMS